MNHLRRRNILSRYYDPYSDMFEVAHTFTIERSAPVWTLKDGTYILTYDVPGVPPEAVSVSVRRCTIKVEVASENREAIFAFPDDADPSTLQATCKHGRLTLAVQQQAWRKVAVQG